MLHQRQLSEVSSVDARSQHNEKANQKDFRISNEASIPKAEKNPANTNLLNRSLQIAPVTENVHPSDAGSTSTNLLVNGTRVPLQLMNQLNALSGNIPGPNNCAHRDPSSIAIPDAQSFNAHHNFQTRNDDEENSILRENLLTLHQKFSLAQREFYSPEVQTKLSNYDSIPGIHSVFEMIASTAGSFMSEQMARLKASNFSFSSQMFHSAIPFNAGASMNQFFDQDTNLTAISGLKRKRSAYIGEEMKQEILSSSLAYSYLTNTNKCSLIDRALFTQIEATMRPLGAAFANFLNTEDGKIILEKETGRSHVEWAQTFSPSASFSGLPVAITSAMIEANAEGIKLQDTLSKRWGYLAKTARDVIRDIRKKETSKLWVQQYEKAYAEYGEMAKELVKAGASGNWGVEDADPYFDKDASNRSNPDAILEARILRRITAGAFSAQYVGHTELSLQRSFQYILSTSDSLPVQFSDEILVQQNGAPRTEQLRQLWLAFASGFFQKAKLQYTELNPIGHSLIYLSIDAAIRGCNMTERSHLTNHVRILSNLHAATIAAEASSAFAVSNPPIPTDNFNIVGINSEGNAAAIRLQSSKQSKE